MENTGKESTNNRGRAWSDVCTSQGIARISGNTKIQEKERHGTDCPPRLLLLKFKLCVSGKICVYFA